MHAISTSKSKVPMLPSQGITYAKFGTWRDHFSSALTLKGLQVFAALDSTIPTEYPEVKEDEDNEDSLELTNVLTLQWKVTNKYDFAAKSAEAYALLYEAATNNVQIQRVMKKHKGNFPLAFASVSHFVMGNVKSAARAQRKEILEEIRKCGDADAAREVITLVNANNDDLKLLGTDDELKDNDLFEELMDVIKEIPSLNNVYHLARMPDTKIGEWDSLTEYMISIIARDDGTMAAHSSQDDNTTDCIGYDEDDHAEQYEDTQEYEQVQEHFKAMSVSSTQPKKEHLYCLMARVATPATPLVASSGIPALQLPFGGDDGDCGVTLVEDEAGTEFKFSDFMPDTLGHSGSIGNLAAIGDHDRIDVDAADTDTFLHTPLLAAGAFAYWSPEGLACLEQLQPVVDQRAHGPVVIAQPPELSTNKSSKSSQNLIKIGNYDEMMTYVRMLSTSPQGKLLRFGAFKRRFKPPERPVLLPTPANSHTPDPMRSFAFVVSSNYVMIGVDSMASGHFFGDRDAFDVNSLVALSDAPQVEIANGAQLAPTHRGVVPLRVRGHGAYAGDDRIVMIQNVNYVPGFPVHRRLLSSGRLERDSTVDGVQRVFVDSLNSAVHMRNHDGTTCYSFALDKEGCVTQLPCVFGAALRDDNDESSELICFAAAARSLGDSVGAPLGESVGAPPVDGSVGVEMNDILTHATSVSPTTATTTATELTAAQVAETNAAIYVKPNAKNPGTKSFARYAKYQSARSAKEYAALGGSRADLRHDLRKGIVVVGTPPVDLFDGLRVPLPRRSKDPTKKRNQRALQSTGFFPHEDANLFFFFYHYDGNSKEMYGNKAKKIQWKVAVAEGHFTMGGTRIPDTTNGKKRIHSRLAKLERRHKKDGMPFLRMLKTVLDEYNSPSIQFNEPVDPDTPTPAPATLERGVSVNDADVEIAQLLMSLPDQDERENAGTVGVKQQPDIVSERP